MALSGTAQMLKSIQMVRSPDDCFHGSYGGIRVSRQTCTQRNWDQNPYERTKTWFVSIRVSCVFSYNVTVPSKDDVLTSGYQVSQSRCELLSIQDTLT